MPREIARRAVIALLPAGLWAPGFAESTEPAAMAAERVEVTGSRIKATDVESASPIHVIGAEDIRVEGYQSLELILNNFPQLVASQGDRVSNGASGTATADLRGIGAERTLTLLNGRRLAPGSPFFLLPDLNQIPVHLISRVEILTGGASAVYGSDAMTGVVNIILDDRFEGVRGEVTHSFYQHRQKNAFMQDLLRARGFDVPGDKSSDGEATGANLAIGGNFAGDKGNGVVSFRYLEKKPLLQSERDYSACALAVLNPNTPRAQYGCGGSGTTYPTRVFDVANNRQWTVTDNSGTVVPWIQATGSYNFAPWNYYQRGGDRYGANAFIKYDLNTHARMYADLGFHDDQTLAQVAPSGVFGSGINNPVFRIRYENPLLSDDWRRRLTFVDANGEPATGPGTVADLLVFRRNVEGGGRRFELRHTSQRQVVGVKGALAGPWEYDISAQFSRVAATQTSEQDFSSSRTARALDVVTDPTTGAPACASVLDGTDPACVPYNVWVRDGVTQGALDYLHSPALQSGSTTQRLFNGVVRADLRDYGVRLPWTRDAAEVALGLERRTDRMRLESDAAFESGDLAGAGAAAPSANGAIAVNEVFAEARLPITDSISLSGSFRVSDYSTGPRTDTFGIGFNAAPTGAWRVRGSYQRAMRAANIIEVFRPQTLSIFGFGADGDPCGGPTPARSLEECQRTGVTASQYGRVPEHPNGFFNGIEGGNPNLEPELGKTLTVGLAFTPTRDFTASIDYFDIAIDGYILSGTPGITVTRCLDSGVLCNLIHREPTSGTLWLAGGYVEANNQNIGRVAISGVDLAFNYRLDRWLFSGVGSYLRSTTVQYYPGDDHIECAGKFFGDCGLPRPKWRHRLRAGWDSPWNAELSATWRYVASMDNETVTAFNNHLKAMNYLDLAASWAFDKRMTLRAGINNVTDEDPPLIAGGVGVVNGNTFVGSYDALGRYVYLSLTAKF